MKKLYLNARKLLLLHKISFSLILALLMGFPVVNAQQNVPVTGFNSDQVANGIGAPTTSSTAGTDNGVDGGGYVFIDGTYQYNATCALATTNLAPANNQVNSTAVPGLTYVLQPYNGNNALRVPATAATAGSGTLTVTTPISAGAIYLLSVSGGGPITNGITITITFTDATTQVFSNRSTEDWCNTTNVPGYTKIATTSYNRIQAPNVTACGNFATCQYFAEMALAIDAANQAKQIASITVAKTATSCVMNVYAVGMVPPCSTPTAQATGLTATTLSTGYINGSFTAAFPAASGYLVVRYPQGATPTSPVTGTAYTAGQSLGTGTVVQSSAATTFTSNGLTPNTPYDFYVYSYFGPCAPTASSPTYLTSTPLTSTLTTIACGGSLSGSMFVGPGQGYGNLTSALAAIGSVGISGPLTIELMPGYDGATETYPITFQGDPCTVSSKSITIRPSSSNFSPLVISSNSSVATIDLNGAKYVTFDGRPGGVGTSKLLSIINTNNAGVAIRFMNDASYNAIKYCDIQGQNTNSTTGASSAQVGVISFWTANSLSMNGNDSNSISFCDIHGTTTGSPAICIASFGNSATTPVNAWNDYNMFDNNNIYDFFSATLASCALKADGGSNRYTLSNNHIYQTVSRTYTSANNHRGFWLTPTATGASGFTVTNNFIGGNDASGAGTYTMFGGAVATNFWGMDINHAGTVHTSVQGNTVTNISLTNSSTTANIFRGISTGGVGHMDIGTISGNLIGSTTVNGVINLTNNSSGGTAYGIVNGGASSSTDSVNIANNTIGGITITSPTANTSEHIIGIGVTTGSYTFITNNLIGSLTNANSLYSMNPVTTAAQSVYGIFVGAGLYSSVINNTIANLTNNTASTSTTANTSYTRGISLTVSSLSVVTGNTVKNIASGSISTGSAGTAPLTGIAINTSNPSTVIGNSVDSVVLMSNSSANATNVDGMLIGLNGSTPTHLIAKNFIHHITADRTGASSAVINGINIIGGSNIIVNNMVQLGLRTDGTTYDTSIVIRGLNLASTASTNVYHNTVYIGGFNVAATAKNTFAFSRSAASGTHQISNNIFVNERSNLSTGGKHYQVFLNNTTGVSLSNNVYYGTGTGNVFGSSNNGTNDVTSFSSGWISADANSAFANPNFITPNGGSVNSGLMVNLHINPAISTPVEGSGIPVASVTDDYDGNARSSNTPVDIGADAGIFTPIGMSIDSTTTAQVSTGTLIGATNQAVIAVKVYAKGAVNPLQLTALKLNTAGTTSVSNIANAKVYYTGGAGTFSTATPFGTTVNNPNGTFYVTGTQTLSVGVNHFWVAYDVSGTATAGSLIDARLDSAGISGNVNANILNGDPAGSRLISAPLSGNYNVGVSQTYPTITAALADLNLLGVNNPVTFTLTDATYSTNETFPIVVTAFAGSSPANTVTIRPALGVTSTITANIGNPVIRLDGVKNFILDGRQGGTVPGKSLTVSNDHLSGSALTFINDASRNILKYTNFKGASTTTTIGVINFATGVISGNDSNTIDNCNIGDAATLPTTLVQARGSFDVTTKFNNGNVFSNCELFNFHNATGESNAFKISKGNTDWTFTGNSIYQTVTRTFAQIHYTFNWNRIVDDASNTNDAMAAASLNNMNVTGNYFGGSAAQCGGTPWTETGSAGPFCSYFNMGDLAKSLVKKNTFSNFNIASTSANANAPGVWNAIQFIGGQMDIDSNIIGSLTDTNSINIVAANLGVIFPIIVSGGTAGTYSINGNKIGGLRIGGTGAASPNVLNMHIVGASNTVTYNIENNNIGVQFIKMLPSTSTSPQLNIGINSTSSANLNIKNNIIHNLYNEQSSTGTSQTIALKSTSGLNVIAGNLIDSLHNFTAQNGTGANASIIGISLTSAAGGSVIDKNTIHRLNSLNIADAVSVTGIYYAGGANDVIGRNLIHSLSTLSTSATSAHNGIVFGGGTTRLQNNTIRLGIDATGISQTNTPVITGLSVTGGNAKVFFNTVYIGGSGVMGASNSFAFNRTATGTDSIYNNVFVNERAGGTGSHYAIGLSSNTNLKANFNLFYNPGGLTLGLFNGATQTDIGNWKTASNVDGNSNSGNPSFTNATGDITTLNLHITGTTPVEGSGLLIAGINNDFDGEVRGNLTPTDIGADAGNFTLSDIFAPAISYTPISSDTVHSALVLTGFASITDASNIDVTANIPRLYYKKSTDNSTFFGNTAFDNGWKYVTASNASSPFSFTIDYSIINGGAVLVTDTIQYFVVAQDVLGNLGANPGAGFTGASVNSIFTAPTTPNFYRIKLNPLNGSYNVGAGQTAPNFTTLTSAMNTLSDVGVGSPVTFRLMDAGYNVGTGETFPLSINGFTGSSAVNTVTIKPASAMNVTIAGNANSIFKLNGADNIILDGSNIINGTTRNLTIIDTANTSAIVWLASAGLNAGAVNVTVKNAILSGNSATAATNFGIFSAGQTLGTGQTGAHNNNLSVLNNRITNVGFGIYANGVSGSKHSTVNISNNFIGDSVNGGTTVGCVGIYLSNAEGLTVASNTILNISSTYTTGGGPHGVSLQAGAVNAVVNNNIISKVIYTGASGYGGKGIDVNTGDANSNIEIRNNMISGISGDGWSTLGSDAIVGIRLLGNSGNIRIYYNSVILAATSSGGTAGNLSAALYAASGISNLNVRNNILVNPMFNTSQLGSKAYAIATDIGGTTAYTFNYNNYSTLGTQGILGYKAGDFATIAAWRTASAQDVNSKNVNVNFVTATDLHLTGTSNGDVNLVATPITGLTTDIDGTTRSAQYPYMGADEASIPVPVKLTAFTATAAGNDVIVSWATASETNNKGFELERSLDGKTFAKIEWVKGAGNSNRVISYNITDAFAFNSANSNTLYYRLKQVDFDNASTYSDVAIVSKDQIPANTGISLYPNPFDSRIAIQLFSASVSKAQINVFDVSGRNIISKQADVAEGLNAIELDSLSVMDKGVYFVSITLNGKTSIQKMVKN